jgi:hypothetical protein
MMNKKLIALLIAVATAGVISAYHGDCYTDEDGYRRCDRRGIVRGTVRGTVGTAGRVAEDTAAIGTGLITAPFGGPTPSENLDRVEAARERHYYRD